MIKNTRLFGNGRRSPLASARAGDAAAVTSLLDQFLDPIRAFVRLCVNRESRLWESASGLVGVICHDHLVDYGLHEFHADANFRAWLFTSVKREVLARQGTRGGASNGLHSEESDPDGRKLALVYSRLSAPRRGESHGDHMLRIETAFEQLDPEQREVLALSRVAGVTHGVIAEYTRRSIGDVRRILGNALADLCRIEATCEARPGDQ